MFEEQQAQFEREQRIYRERSVEQEAKDDALIEQMEDIQARIDADAQLAERLQQEKREQVIVDEKARILVDLIAERKRFFVAQRAEQIRNKPPTRTQLRNKMVTYLKHMGRYTHNQLKSKSFKEIKKLYEKEQKWINDFVPLDSEVVKDSGKKDDDNQKQAESSKKRTRAEYDEESIKKHKLEDDAETEELKACLDIVPKDDIAINVESLATKYPIIFSEMLNDFDRQDIVDLYRLVQERYETTRPEGYDLLLWGDLKTLFEPFHILLMDTGIAIHIMVEKKYPLTQEMLSRMLNRILEVDHESTMAFELIRFIKAQLEE
ncbi:hypothetical protein Tco_0995225 [Tanacetum coccineum]